MGDDPSQLLGALSSNGNVFLVNGNGIVVAADARIDTAGLALSALDIRDEYFVKGVARFDAGTGSAGVVNNGAINSAGNVVLLGTTVSNNGVIRSEGGKVLLAAGQKVTLNSLRDPSVKYVVSAPENESVNLGDILSTSGRIEISGGKAVAGGRVDVSGTKGGSVVVAGTGTKGQAQVCSKTRFSEVLSSEWCRCKETTELLGLQQWSTFSGLNSFFQDYAEKSDVKERLVQKLNNLNPGVTLMVSHQVVIRAATGQSVASGELVAFNTRSKETYKFQLD